MAVNKPAKLKFAPLGVALAAPGHVRNRLPGHKTHLAKMTAPFIKPTIVPKPASAIAALPAPAASVTPGNRVVPSVHALNNAIRNIAAPNPRQIVPPLEPAPEKRPGRLATGVPRKAVPPQRRL